MAAARIGTMFAAASSNTTNNNTISATTNRALSAGDTAFFIVCVRGGTLGQVTGVTGLAADAVVEILFAQQGTGAGINIVRAYFPTGMVTSRPLSFTLDAAATRKGLHGEAWSGIGNATVHAQGSTGATSGTPSAGTTTAISVTDGVHIAAYAVNNTGGALSATAGSDADGLMTEFFDTNIGTSTFLWGYAQSRAVSAAHAGGTTAPLGTFTGTAASWEGLQGVWGPPSTVVNGTGTGTSATTGVATGTATHHLYSGSGTGTSATTGVATGVATSTGVSGTGAGTSASTGAATGTVTRHVYHGTGTGTSASTGTSTGTAVHHMYSGTGASVSASTGAAAGTATRHVYQGTGLGRSPSSGAAVVTNTHFGTAESVAISYGSAVGSHHIYGIGIGRSASHGNVEGDDLSIKRTAIAAALTSAGVNLGAAMSGAELREALRIIELGGGIATKAADAIGTFDTWVVGEVGDATNFITVKSGRAGHNTGIVSIQIAVAAGDTLACSNTAGALKIDLANTTGAKNTLTLVAAAIAAAASAGREVSCVISGTASTQMSHGGTNTVAATPAGGTAGGGVLSSTAGVAATGAITYAPTA